MFGLILEFYLGTTQDPIGITKTGSLEKLRATRDVNPAEIVDTWPRDEVIPIEVHNVTSDFGGPLPAYICARRGSRYANGRHARKDTEQ